MAALLPGGTPVHHQRRQGCCPGGRGPRAWRPPRVCASHIRHADHHLFLGQGRGALDATLDRRRLHGRLGDSAGGRRAHPQAHLLPHPAPRHQRRQQGCAAVGRAGQGGQAVACWQHPTGASRWATLATASCHSTPDGGRVSTAAAF